MDKPILLGLAVLSILVLPQAARAGQDSYLEYQRHEARRMLDNARESHPLRAGCTQYVYGCGYGTVPGYGSVPGYGDNKLLRR